MRSILLSCLLVTCVPAVSTIDCRAEVNRRARDDTEIECTPGTTWEDCEQIILDRAAVERKACR